MRLPRLLTLATLLLCARSVGLHAQSLTFGELVGTVSDAARVPIADAEVRAVEKSSGAVRWLLTARDGKFRFAALPAGRYDVTVEALGYRPVVHLDVSIAAGFSASLPTILRATAPPVTSIDTVRAALSSVRVASWLSDRGYSDLVGARRIGSEAAALTTTADEFGVEGLPWRLTESMVDGARSSGVGGAGGTGADAAGLALPMRSASSLSVGGLGFDVEAGGSGVGITATTLRGGRRGASRTIVEGGTASIGGAFIAGGPIQGDTASVIGGVDYQRSEISRPSFFGTNDAFAADVTNAAQGTYSTDIAAYGVPAKRLDERMSAFARLDWQPSDRLAISARASGSRFTSSGLAERAGPLAELGADFEATGAQLSFSVLGRFSQRISSEIRFSADVSEASAAPPLLPATSFAGSGFAIGGVGGESFDDARTTPRLATMLHFDLGAHRVKTGFSVASHRFDSRFVAGESGDFRFGDVADFAGGDGAWRRVEGAQPSGGFRMTETAFFVQDAWQVADGLSVTLGTRIDGARFPGGDIESNTQLLALTGLDNGAVEGKRSRLSPRLGVRWELGSERQWVLDGGVGVFRDLPDRRDFAEALTFDRGASVRYGVGPISSWPSAPDSLAAPVVGRTVTLLGPQFEGPRTQRMTLGVTRRLGSWSLSAAGTYRYTDFIARRRDLNLPSTPLGVDQHGRPLFGVVRKVGTLLAASPQSNRRFNELDAVYGLEASGFSDYRAASVGLERVRPHGISIGLHYTYSITTDNVRMLAPSGISPTLMQSADWGEGTSDLDVPHRLLAALEWSSGEEGAVRFGAIYRLSSGLPFTPGVRDGVDANADGDGTNDPAFIDVNIPGIPALLGTNACLRTQAGGFAERNSCRGELSHRLDVRASFRIVELAIGRVDLVVDALDAIATESGHVDDALLLVDRAGSVSTNPATGVTTVPYIVNPNFGQVLADRSPGVLWRVGLRIVP